MLTQWHKEELVTVQGCLTMETTCSKRWLMSRGSYDQSRVAILDSVLSKQKKKKVRRGPVEPGQRVQTAFTSNPAGLWSRLSKAAELPEERILPTNPVHEQNIRDDPYNSTDAPRLRTTDMLLSAPIRICCSVIGVLIFVFTCPHLFHSAW